jgi:prephenate dehydratase
VAFQGEPGAFSEAAVRQACGDGVETMPCRTLRDAFAAVTGGSAELAVVPVENSRAGSIPETYDLLREHPLVVRGEVAVRVEQCLLAPRGLRLEDVRRVYSHPQALAQCESYLRGLGVETIAVYDTAGSARALAGQAETGAAAIASARAAEIYGLEVLARGIQEDPHNTTRFYVAGPPGPPVPAGGPVWHTVLALHLPGDDTPGALYWSLGTLAYWRINLLKIESRPSRSRQWHHHFYLELAARDEDAGCRAAIAEMEARGAQVRVLGSYPAASLAG